MELPSSHKEFEDVINEYRLLIYKVSGIYSKNTEDRRDLYQEIVLQIWRAFPKFRGDSKKSTWLYQIALNTAIKSLRRKRPKTVEFSPYIHSISQQPEDPRVADLYSAISNLNEIEKAIVMLYLDDISYESMQQIMGISSGTLRVKMNRIKEKLRNLTKSP